MKAVILVGGYGTRLRPLTLSVPKPLVEFCNKTMLAHQIEALVEVGVKEVILAVSYQPQVMEERMKKYETKYGIKITLSKEPEPLGTAGPLAFARNLLEGKEPFFVLNSDIICKFDLKTLIAFHKEHGKEGTIMITKVEDPSKYGVIVGNERGEIQKFVEKPTTFVSNKINAGIYIFNPTILKRIEPKPTSIEKEIFPKMAEDKQLYSLDLQGFWMDIGQPKDFLSAVSLYLTHLKSVLPANASSANYGGKLKTGKGFKGDVLMDETAKIGESCEIGPNVVIGPNCVIEDGVRLKNTILLEGVKIRSYSWIDNSIIGWQSSVGRWVRIEKNSVLGEDVHIEDELYINGAKILPHRNVNFNIPQPEVIM